MKLFFVANSLTEPTRETMEEVATKSFRKLARLIDEKDAEAEIRISAEKEGNEFVITTDVRTFKRGNHISKCKNIDIRRAVNDCASELKRILRKEKDKITRRKKSIVKIGAL